MGERMSIYAGEPVQRALACLGPTYDENRSGRLNTVCERYLAMVDDELARLDLSESEWCAILEANNDVEIGVESHGHVLIWANVHDCRGLSERWGVDQQALAKKLHQLPRSTLIAIREVADRFWSATNGDDPVNGRTIADDLRRAGVRLPNRRNEKGAPPAPANRD